MNSRQEFDTDEKADDIYEKARVVFNEAKYQKAISILNRLIILYSNYDKAYLLRSWARLETSDSNGFVDDNKKAIQINPNNNEPYLNLAQFYEKSKSYSDALICRNKYVELNPSDGIGYYIRGQLFEKMNDIDDAKSDYKKSCDLGFSLGCRK